MKKTKALSQERFHEKTFQKTCGGRKGWLKKRYEREVRKALSLIPSNGLRVLDAGCNTGVVSKKIIDKGNQVYGVDVSEKALKEARKRGVKTSKASLQEKLPFKDKFFDLVFASSVIEHLYDPEFFLKESARVLKQGGHILLFTPNLACLPNRIRLFFGFHPRNSAPALDWHQGGHIRVMTFKALKKILERNNFKAKRFASTTVYLLPLAQRNGPNSWLLARLFPMLGERLIVLAQKV